MESRAEPKLKSPGFPGGAAQPRAFLNRHGASLDIPFCDTRGWYVDQAGLTAERPNRLAGKDARPDEAAVLSLLQFGAIVPPHSPWEGVRRLLPGYSYTGNEEPQPRRIVCHLAGLSALSEEEQADRVESVLDECLKRLLDPNDKPVVLFSGGVDSGLIAARLAALGYRDTLLLHSSFGPEDPESQIAQHMAACLKLPFERICASNRLCDCLDAPGIWYPQPFGDHATVCAWGFGWAVVERLAGRNHVVLDGTGGDGAFGLSAKIPWWLLSSKVPALLRVAGSAVHRKLSWCRFTTLEHLLRPFSRLSQLPLPCAIVAQNSLGGVLYQQPAVGASKELVCWIRGWAGDDVYIQTLAADLALTCANMFAQKLEPLLHSAGHAVRYPFLSEPMVALALATARCWRSKRPKAPLKCSLARMVPSQLVYRRKSGFVDMTGRVFYTPDFIAYLRASVEPSAPIAPLLIRDNVLKSCDILWRKRPLPPQTLNCLWTIVFADRWYRTAQPGAAY